MRFRNQNSCTLLRAMTLRYSGQLQNHLNRSSLGQPTFPFSSQPAVLLQELNCFRSVVDSWTRPENLSLTRNRSHTRSTARNRLPHLARGARRTTVSIPSVCLSGGPEVSRKKEFGCQQVGFTCEAFDFAFFELVARAQRARRRGRFAA